MKLHVIGIGGTGMRGIAEIASAKGHLVTGSDLKRSSNVDKLEKKGIKIFNEHSKRNVEKVNAIIVSGMIDNDNPEILEAKLRHIPIWSRMQGLDRLLHGSGQRISVIGSVGKTTTTALLESAFSNGINPTVYMGAESKTTGESGSLGDGRIAIIESCEYQGAFFGFRTDNIILTDIVPNHENYFGTDIDSVSSAFVNFIESSLASKVFLPANIEDNPAFKDLIRDNKVVTYGLHSGSWRANIISRNHFTTMFQVQHNNTVAGEFLINMPGDHLVKNLIPGIALAMEFGISPNVIRDGLLNARLPNRRFDVKYQSDHYIGIDDNARNPSQLASTLSVISRFLPNYRIVVVAGMWGHLNPRPLHQFAEVLKNVDAVMIADIGRAARSMGGAEDDNAIELLIEELANFEVIGVRGISIAQICEKVENLSKDGPVALLTFGYDNYKENFIEIHNAVISNIKHRFEPANF
ncbi:Mur ligase domain-containing protein [Paenibacillus glycinis]|uniref:UDP-N-acetylmuramate--L-alanine ligase n=1 Tax=Paenibacillus glycinis TaxID=2697035 RepID=A0ABW9XSB9_9BACL|nr:Mur ligase domain-containing protein [Paenibacillus glycinis]NBD25525.1 hypothetical protein [Paenibacillus glycinis]